MEATVAHAEQTLEELVGLSEVNCEDVLAPIPGERWICVGLSGHGPGEHIAEDGTVW